MASRKTLPRLLWISPGGTDELRAHEALVRQFFDLKTCFDLAAAAREIRMLEPRALCFEFDAPQAAELRTLQRIKRNNPRLPVLMLTETHSEELAIWAFRSQVWNYVARPVTPAELEENLVLLARIVTSQSSARPPLRVASTPPPAGLSAVAPRGDRLRLRPAVQRINDGYAERVSIGELARACGMTSFEFSRRFRACYGVSCREYLLRYRVERAAALLEQAPMSMIEVGVAVGLPDPSHFSASFRRFVGVTPRAYIQQRRARRARSAGPRE
jgi:AraC-like DNA-binding protein